MLKFIKKVNLGIPLIDTTTYKIKYSKYVFEVTKEIHSQESINNLKDKYRKRLFTKYVIINL